MGTTMDAQETEMLLDDVASVVKLAIGQSVEPILTRLTALEKQVAAIPPVRDGKDADMDEVRSIVVDEIADLKTLIEAIQPAPLLPDIGKMVEDAVAARVPEDLDDRIEIASRKAFDEMEWPKDGVGVAGGLIDKSGHFNLTLSDGQVKDLGPVCGKDGVSIDTAAVQKQIADMFDALPKAKDGTSVSVDDVMPAIEAMIAEKVAAIPKAKDGASVTLDDVAPMIEAEVAKRVSEIPAAKDGEPGKNADPAVIKQMVEEVVAALPPAQNGKDCDMAAVEARLAAGIEAAQAVIADAIAAIPKPQDGKSISVADVTPMIQEAVQKAVDAIPRPADGKDGAPGERGEKGEPGPQGEKGDTGERGIQGEKGADGIGLAGAFQNKDGDLMITLSSGQVVNVGRVMGCDGADVDMESIRQRIDKMFAEWPKPKDGLDGLGFDDLDLAYDGEKTFTFTLSRGDRRKEFTFVMPVVVDKGVFKEGQAYLPGDGVTWGGSFWICQTETKEKPDSAKDWRLAVKRGKDGKDADPKSPAKPNPVKL